MEEDLVHYIRSNAYQMKKEYDEHGTSDMMFYYVSKMLQILRQEYQPRKYYEAYTQVVQELSHLSLQLMDCDNEEISSLYDRAQYNIFTVPRMYTLILIGSIAIRKKVDSALNIIQDIHELCRCVQHPVRGMFVRYYLITTLKGLIPNKESDCDNGNDFEELLKFVLNNFTEMNKLWVRMQYFGASEDKKRIEMERSELKILIASNLVKLCEMCDDDSLFYEEKVLRVIMDDIIISNDYYAEEFLFECILNIFPETFHASKLNIMIEMLSTLDSKINFGRCFKLLCDRVQLRISQLKSEGNITESGHILMNLLKCMEIFDIKGADKINMSTRLIFYSALLASVLKTFPEKLNYLDELFGQIIKGIDNGVTNHDTNKDLNNLMINVINDSKDINVILSIPNFIPLFKLIDYKTPLSCHIVDKAVEQGVIFYDTITTSNILTIVNPILTEKYDENDIAEVEESWGHVCTVLRLIRIDDPFEKFEIFKNIPQEIFHNNTHSKILRIVLSTFVVEIVKMLDNIYKIRDENQTKYDNVMREVGQFVFNLSKLLTIPDDSDFAIYLFMTYAIRMDKYKFETTDEIMYEFLSKVFTYYEEDILDNQNQLAIIQSIITEIYKLKNLSKDNRLYFYQRCVQSSLKLLKKRDQCSVTLQATKLYYIPDDNELQGHIKKILVRLEKIASQCIDEEVRIECHIDILENYVYYYSLSCPNIIIDDVRNLYQKIKMDMHSGSTNIKNNNTVLEYFGSVCTFIQQSYPVIWEVLASSE